jgi:hypothetical protein
MEIGKKCITLREHGFSIRKIAEDLGIAPSTVRWHIRHLPSISPTIKRQAKQREQILLMERSNDLAYFMGVFAGDGCLTRTGRSCKLLISCDQSHPYLIEEYTALLTRITGKTAKQRKHKNANCVEIYVYGIDLPNSLALPVGNKNTNGFVVPDWIYSADEYLKMFLKGLIETDGGVYKTFKNGGWYTYVHFVQKNTEVQKAFEIASYACGYPFVKQDATHYRLSSTKLADEMINNLDLTKKIRVYQYS